MKKALETPGLTAPDAVAMLIKSISALDDEVPQGLAQRLINETQSPGHTEPASVTGTIQVAMSVMKKNLLEEIEAFQNSHQKAPEEKEFRSWLSDTLDRYTQWRLRLR